MADLGALLVMVFPRHPEMAEEISAHCGMVFSQWDAGVVAGGEHSFGTTPRLDVHSTRKEGQESPSHL